MPKYRCTGRYTVHTKALRTGEVGSNNSECSVMQCKASQSDILTKGTSCASKNINQKTRCLIQAKGC